MALESVAYGTGLNVANPPNTDQRKQGDDHLRLIKTAVLQSLQLMGGGMTTGGSATALTVTTGHVNSPTYQDGHLYVFALHTNIGAAATVNYDAIGARTLKKKAAAGWADVAANDFASGDVLLCYYEAGDTTMRIVASAVLTRQGGIVGGPILGPDGTAGAATFGRSAAPSTGIFFGAANEVALSVGGTARLTAEGSGGSIAGRLLTTGEVQTTGVAPVRPGNDANFALYLDTNPTLVVDTNDLFYYDRGTNVYAWIIGAVERGRLSVARGFLAKNTPAAVVSFHYPGSVPTLLNSMNVSSLTDNGVGDVTVNLITALAHDEPIVAHGGASIVAAGNHITLRNMDRVQSTTALQVYNMTLTGVLVDALRGSCVWIEGV